MLPARLILTLLAFVPLAACGANEGALEVTFIDSPDQLFADGVRLSPGAQHLRGATHSGRWWWPTT